MAGFNGLRRPSRTGRRRPGRRAGPPRCRPCGRARKPGARSGSGAIDASTNHGRRPPDDRGARSRRRPNRGRSGGRRLRTRGPARGRPAAPAQAPDSQGPMGRWERRIQAVHDRSPELVSVPRTFVPCADETGPCVVGRLVSLYHTHPRNHQPQAGPISDIHHHDIRPGGRPENLVEDRLAPESAIPGLAALADDDDLDPVLPREGPDRP